MNAPPMQLDFRGHDARCSTRRARSTGPRRDLLVVADLHLEKGSAFARRGTLLPPYDTHATLARLEELVAAGAPATCVSLGDGFHDRRGGRRAVARPVRPPGGAHPQPALGLGHRQPRPVGRLALGGAVVAALALDGLVLRHEPTGAPGEIAGHLHPKARVRDRRCACAGPASSPTPSAC